MKAVPETVIIEKVPDDDFTRGVIIHGDFKWKKGIIEAVGEGMDYKIEPGDNIWYNRYADAGYHITEGEKEYLILRSVDIHGFVNENNHKEW